ncbi:MAG: leucyl/phenylalanyl-tRNA--protein transferase [Actinomycetota bacterium]|nr:leucyl/phenylalanyl-tRNA--protein transferase [Actinomycetota bacterium]
MDAAAFFEELDVDAAPRDLIALGGSLDAATLQAAYRSGCFPWPHSGRHARSLERQAQRLARSGEVPLLAGEHRHRLLPWCSPDPRAVLLADRLTVSRSLRQRMRRCGWTTTMDRAFADVVDGCRQRDETWITPMMRQAYVELHLAGAAHSLEVWEGRLLVGGLYGVLTGGVFSGESMFHRETDASKVAVVDLCRRLREAGVLLVDTQQASAHLAALGQLVVRRSEYLAVLQALRDQRPVLPRERREVTAG